MCPFADQRIGSLRNLFLYARVFILNRKKICPYRGTIVIDGRDSFCQELMVCSLSVEIA